MQTINPTELLKDYFYKSLLIQLSTKAIDNNWGEELSASITNHAFTDPFNVEEQTDRDEVQRFNKLMDTNWSTIKWRMVKSSKSQLYINEENKDEFVLDAISQLYLQLSVPLFENLIELLNLFINDDNGKRYRSFLAINKFYEIFGKEIKELDEKNITYQYPTILLLHNLCHFRNCVTHGNSQVSWLENEFNTFNEKMNKGEGDYRSIKALGPLAKVIFCYKFSKNGLKMFLDKTAFKDLTDLYSQIAYVAYRCFCKKNNHPIYI